MTRTEEAVSWPACEVLPSPMPSAASAVQDEEDVGLSWTALTASDGTGDGVNGTGEAGKMGTAGWQLGGEVASAVWTAEESWGSDRPYQPLYPIIPIRLKEVQECEISPAVRGGASDGCEDGGAAARSATEGEPGRQAEAQVTDDTERLPTREKC